MNILHIAAHLGGGAGKAISGIAIQGQQLFSDTHRILLLQQPEKDGYVKECDAQGIEIQLWTGDYELLRWADVIVVSWWNHPAMAAFFAGTAPDLSPFAAVEPYKWLSLSNIAIRFCVSL